MITAVLLGFVFFLYSLALLFLGYFFHGDKKDLPDSDYVLGYAPGTNSDKPIMIRKPKPGGIFKGEDVPSGPVQRPTAQQIAKWKENPVKAGTQEAMSETFYNNPELREAKQFVESTHKNEKAQ